MDNKAFVFSGMSLLLVLPAILLAASLLNMMKYGEGATTIAISGGTVFYTCQNIIDFLQGGAVDGRREYAIDQASVFAQSRGMNFTVTNSSNTAYQIYLTMPGGLTCNRTIELRRGTLNVDLNLSGWNTTIDSLPVYFRTGRNNIINTTTYVQTLSLGAVTGATVNLDILNESFTGSTVAGYYRKSLNLSNYVDTTDRCTRKFYLGQHTATATASLSEWYDGSDSELFRILGDMSRSTMVGYKPTRTTLGVKIALVDEYGDPVTEYFFAAPDRPNCDGNYTLPMPSITAKIYEDSIAPGNLKATYVSPTNISEDEPPVDSGIYKTSTGISFVVTKVYLAIVNVTSSDYLPFSFTGDISFTDFEAPNVAYGDGTGGICKGTVGGPVGPDKKVIQLNVTNVGTTDDTTWKNYTVAYAHTNASNIFSTLNYTYYPGPGAKRGASSWVICSGPVTLTSGTFISANITFVGRPNLDVDLTNNLVNGTA